MLTAKDIAFLKTMKWTDYDYDDENARSVPIVIAASKDEFDLIRDSKTSNRWDKNIILNIIAKYSPDIYREIEKMKKSLFVEASEVTYDRLINGYVAASESNIKKNWSWFSTKYVYVDAYQLYLDFTCNRIIVSIYYGSRK